MKKNLMSVLILALVVANLILTAVLTISVLPQTKQANELIGKVCAAIDLDLEGGSLDVVSTVPLDQQISHNLNGGESMTINLKPGEDGVQHYAVMKVSLSFDKNNKDYKTYGTAEQLADKENLMQQCVYTTVGGHTVDEMRNEETAIREEILKALRQMYDSDFVVSVSYTVTYN